MAAAFSNLTSELECAICSDLLTQPKFIGQCNHTFCRNCIHQLWVSHGRRKIVPCPQCRKDCPIPSNGGKGLKDNFMVANIIETYRKQQRAANLVKTKCTLCPNGVSCFCKECDLKLCSVCKRRHDHDPKKRDHELFGLCPFHGSGLLFFCHPCKKAVCGGCKVSDHDEGDHDVTPIRPVVDKLKARIHTYSAELEDAVRTKVGEQEEKLSHLCDNVEQMSTSAEVQAAASFERNMVGKRKEVEDLRAESQIIHRQIDILVREVEEVDAKLVQDVDNLTNGKAKTIADVLEKFTKSSEEINLRLRSLETRRKEMTTKLEQGRAVGSAKITIDTTSIANLTSLSHELMDLVNASRQSDTKTLVEEVTRSISEFGLDIVDEGQGLVVMDPQIKRGKTKRVFRQLKKLCNVTFPRDQQCNAVYRLRHGLGPDSRLATLGRSRLSGCADTIYLHDSASSSLTGTITEGVHPARDIAVLSTGEVVVARGEKPPLRVFNPATGAYRDIIIITDNGKVIDKLWYVETDESDNMFVLTFYSNHVFLLLVKPNGNGIRSAQLRGDAYNMAFCSLNRILYIATDERILRFHCVSNILNEIPSSPHGVAGFRCYDVCVRSGGEVFVAGRMPNGEIVIYQVTEGEHEDDLTWRKMEYQDGVKRKVFNWPLMCICDDKLWLRHKGEIERFQLIKAHEGCKMAAADSTLSIELECAVCSDQLNQPKYIGPCNHTLAGGGQFLAQNVYRNVRFRKKAGMT